MRPKDKDSLKSKKKKGKENSKLRELLLKQRLPKGRKKSLNWRDSRKRRPKRSSKRRSKKRKRRERLLIRRKVRKRASQRQLRTPPHSRTSSWWTLFWLEWASRTPWWWDCRLPSKSTRMRTLFSSKLRSSTSCSRWPCIISWCSSSRMLTCRSWCNSRCWARADPLLLLPPRTRASSLPESLLLTSQWCNRRTQCWAWCLVVFPIWVPPVLAKIHNSSSCLSNHSCRWCTPVQLKVLTSSNKTSKVKTMTSELRNNDVASLNVGIGIKWLNNIKWH